MSEQLRQKRRKATFSNIL